MSRSMPAPHQRFATHQLKSIPVPASAALLADASKVWQATIQQLTNDVRSCMVLRCEELPLVLINDDVLHVAFTTLLKLIIKGRTSEAKLYLLISASVQPNDDIDLALPIGYRRWFIQLQTNVSFSEKTVKAHQQEVDKLNMLIQPFGGDFIVTQLKNSGSVFILSLPGKQ